MVRGGGQYNNVPTTISDFSEVYQAEVKRRLNETGGELKFVWQPRGSNRAQTFQGPWTPGRGINPFQGPSWLRGGDLRAIIADPALRVSLPPAVQRAIRKANA